MKVKHDSDDRRARWIRGLRATEEGRRILEEERAVLEATEAIAELMHAQGVSKARLADRLGKSAAFVTKLLSGDNNFTLRTLADVYFALGRSVHVTNAPVGDRLRVAVAPDMREVCIDAPKWSPEPPRDEIRPLVLTMSREGRRDDINDPRNDVAA